MSARRPSDLLEVAGDGIGRDREVRRVPAGHAAPEQEHLRRLVSYLGARRDGLGERPVRAHVHPIGREARVLTEECFDLVQGRPAGGSGRAVLVDQGLRFLHQILDVSLALDFSHAV